MPLTILTTTACSFNKSFDTLLMVDSSVQGVIEAMSSSSASGCASTLVDLQQQLVDKAGWICGGTDTIVNEPFDQVLRDHPHLHDAVKAQVSVLCQSFK